MIKRLYFLILFCFLMSVQNMAQVVTINPTFATQNDQVTIFFDASKGNKELIGQNVVYAHTGVITNLSATPTSWKYVQGNWGTDDAKVKMTKIGTNLFSLTYTIKTFYAVPINENVLKLAFVFRNQAGTLVGRESDGADIFVTIGDGSFQAKFDIEKSQLLSIGDTIKIKAVTSKKANLKLYKNGVVVGSSANDSILTLTQPALASGYGKYKYIFEATYNGNTLRDTMYVIVRGSPAIASTPIGIKDGINYISDTSVILQIYAPLKNFIYVWGDHSGWELDPKYYMNMTPNGQRFWVQINGLVPGKEYRFQYVIDQQLLKVADIYADKLLDGNNDNYIPTITYQDLISYPKNKTSEYVSVFQTAQTNFNWQFSNSFSKPAVEKLLIYELHLRDFLSRHDFQTLIDTLNYIQGLGMNAIELMPINEFEGNESWGYNPAFYFAVDKYYGTKNAFKSLVDECHKRGIAVIMDMVLNHSFGQSPMVRMYFDGSTGKPSTDNPWFNVSDKHPYGVGYDFNHESLATQKFVDSVLRYWLEEYKIDGYRFDLSKGFTQKDTYGNVGAWGAYDAGRIAIWKRIIDKVRTYNSSNPYMILEHFADNSEEKVLAEYGFLVWGNLNNSFNEATMGYVSTSDLSWGNYKTRNWSVPNLVTYAESHDEERLMFKNITYGNSNGNYSTKNLTTALKRNEMAMCFLIPLQGPKMIWQFGELGYDVSIDFNGRVGNKPIKWEYFINSSRKRLHDVIATLTYLKQTQPSYSSSSYNYNVSTAVKLYKVTDSTLNTICVGNFNVKMDSIVPIFHHVGVWYNLFKNDSILVTDINQKIVLNAGEYQFLTDKKLTLPFVITSINEINSTEYNFEVYPNPSNEDINIEWDNQSNEKVEIVLVDLLGRKVFEKSIQVNNGFINLNRAELNIKPGTYILKFQQGKLIRQTKVITL